MYSPGEWEMEHVPHSIYIQPLRTYDIWPYNPNTPINIPYLQTINTFNDWRIVPTSRPLVNPPPFKEDYTDIPGTYGSLDFSRARTGLPIYGNRTGSWEFVVLNDFRPWEQAYSEIQHTLHGKRCIVTLEDDLDHYYVGNLTLNEWRSDPGWSRIVINYNLEPFKYDKTNSIFSFAIDQYGSYSLSLTPEQIGRAPIWPWVRCTPTTSAEEAKLLITCANAETNSVGTVDLLDKNIYKQIPEFLLSNESGENTIDLIFMDSRAEGASGSFRVDMFFTRGYM